MSSETLRANQLRLYLSTLAYVLMVALRCLGLQGPSWERARDDLTSSSIRNWVSIKVISGMVLNPLQNRPGSDPRF